MKDFMLPNARFNRRRAFLGQLALGALASTLPAWGISPLKTALPQTKLPIMLDQVTLADFSPHVDTVFVLGSGTAPGLPVRLVEAVALGSSGARPAHLAARTPFSLVFRAPAGTDLSQQIYRLHHESLGDLEVFLVPIGRDQDGLKLEAVFN